MPAIPLPADLRDGEVALRAFEPGDVPAVTAACQDPLIARFTMVPTPYGEEHARAWIAGQAEQRAGEALDLAVVDVRTGVLLGAVGLAGLDWEHRRAEAGYWVAPEARRRGVAVRALDLLAAWALGPPLALTRIALTVDVENAVSGRVAERAGFAHEGVLPSHLEAKGRRWDIAVYARLAHRP